MFLSIVVPVYNVEKYIAECLDSLLCQNVDKSEYEIICVDDKSTDSSAEIIEKYAKSNGNLKLIRLSENKGVSVARNAGMDEAKGDYIWFVDSDDFIAPNCLKDIFSLIKSSNTDMVFVKPVSFKDGIDTSIYKNNEVKENETTAMHDDWLWTRIFKRNIIVNSNVRFDSNVKFGEDHLFCCLIELFIDKTTQLDKVCYFYRRRPGSLYCASSDVALEQHTYIAKFLKDYAKTDDVYEKIKYHIYTFITSSLFMISYLPHKESSAWLKDLEEAKLFPLKNWNQQFFYSANDDSVEKKKLIDLKNKCYTKKGYQRLRNFRFWLKVKRKLKRIFK